MYKNIDTFVQGFANGGGVGFERGRGSIYDSYLSAKKKKKKKKEKEKSFSDGPGFAITGSGDFGDTDDLATAYEISEALGGRDDSGDDPVDNFLEATFKIPSITQVDQSEPVAYPSALDPLTAYGRRGPDVRRFFDDSELQDTGGPRFLPITGQIYTSEPMSSAVGGLIDDHEYRHLALNELRNVMGKRNPAENIYKYGQPMMDAVSDILDFSGSRTQGKNLRDILREEKFVELFDPPALDEGPYGRDHLSTIDPRTVFEQLAMIDEDAGSVQLQSPELRGGIQDVLAGRMSMGDFFNLPQVQEVARIIDENPENFRPEFLKTINDPRQIMPVMQGLGTFLDRLPAPRAATGEIRPEFSDAERLLSYYKSQTGEGYSSMKNKSPEERRRLSKILVDLQEGLGGVLGGSRLNPKQFEKFMFPTATNNNVSEGMGSVEQGAMQVRDIPLDIQAYIDDLSARAPIVEFNNLKGQMIAGGSRGANLEFALDNLARRLGIERPDK